MGLARTLDPPYESGEAAAYAVRCSCDPGPNGDGGQTVVDHIRLFPVREDVRWNYAVHEQILPALRRAKIPVRWTDVTVRHTGNTDPALRERKLKSESRRLLSGGLNTLAHVVGASGRYSPLSVTDLPR